MGVWRSFWVFAITLSWLQATAQPADLAHDPLLQKRLTVWLKMEPLRDALDTIGKQTGVTLRCQDAIAQEKVAIFVRERPAYEILTQLAGALRYAWRRDGDAYVLYVPDETRQAEEKAADEIYDHRYITLRERIFAARELAAFPKARLTELREKFLRSPVPEEYFLKPRWRELLSSLVPEDETREVIDPSTGEQSTEKTGIHSYKPEGVAWICLASLPMYEIDALARGEWIGFSTKPAENVYPFPQKVRLPANLRNGTIDTTKKSPEFSATPENPEFVCLWIRYCPLAEGLAFRIASICKRSLIDAEGVSDFTQLCLADEFQSLWNNDRLELGALDYWEQWQTPKETLLSILKARPPSTEQPPPLPEYPSAYRFARLVQYYTTADWLEQLAWLTETPVVADAFRTACASSLERRDDVEDLLDRVSYSLWLRWDESGYLLGRHRLYWERRRSEMPEAWLRPLEEKYRQRTLELWDYAELASKITRTQMDLLYFSEAPLLTQFDLAPLRACLPALRFLASLNANQRQVIASGEWIPSSQLTPYQQQQFAVALSDIFPSLQQLFREQLPPADEEVNKSTWRERNNDTFLLLHLEEAGTQNESAQSPAEAVRLIKYPNEVVYSLEGTRQSLHTDDPEVIHKCRSTYPDAKRYADTYQVGVIEFVAPNRHPKRYIFALEYRDPYTLPPAEPTSDSDKEREQKP